MYNAHSELKTGNSLSADAWFRYYVHNKYYKECNVEETFRSYCDNACHAGRL